MSVCAQFFLYPTISKDFSKISFETAWTDDKEEMEHDSHKAMAYAGIFTFTSTCLLISIVRTIATNPGNIPEHKEWDMSTDNTSASDREDP